MNLEREIRIRDLFWYVLSKWKLLILLIILGAVLSGAFTYLKGTEITVNSETGEIIHDNEKSTLAIRSGDSGKEIPEEVAALPLDDIRALTAYYSYLKLYDAQYEYNSTAEIMQLDPLNTYCGYISYLLKVEDQDMLQPVIKAYDISIRAITEKYGELVGGGSSVYSTAAEALGANETFDQAEITSALSFYVYGSSEESCRERIREIQGVLDGASSGISTSLAVNKLSLISENYRKEVGSDILAKQKANIDLLNGYVTNLNNAVKNLSEAGKRFVSSGNVLVYKDCIEKIEAEQFAPEGLINTETRTIRSFSKRNFLLGAAVGLILGIILLVLYYVTSSRIKSEEDIEKLTQIPFLSFIRDDRKRKRFFIDAAIERRRYRNLRYFSEEDGLKAAAVKIERFAADHEISKIYVSGSFMSEKEKTIIEKLNAILNKAGMELCADGTTARSAMAVEEASKTGFAVLAEREWKSYYETVRNTVREFQDAGVVVLGLIVTE
ncbi:MAG: hypothetical protein IKG70_05585 [Lachnospiraceae bacterium]|nr:hypothetical protein [Lachnospiraceae bacterium]